MWEPAPTREGWEPLPDPPRRPPAGDYVDEGQEVGWNGGGCGGSLGGGGGLVAGEGEAGEVDATMGSQTREVGADDVSSEGKFPAPG